MAFGAQDRVVECSADACLARGEAEHQQGRCGGHRDADCAVHLPEDSTPSSVRESGSGTTYTLDVVRIADGGVSVAVVTVVCMSVADLASCRHGTCARYNSGCRCADCRAANTARKRVQRARWANDSALDAEVAWRPQATPAEPRRVRATVAPALERPERRRRTPAADPRLAGGLAPVRVVSSPSHRRVRTVPDRTGVGDGRGLADLVGGLLGAHRAPPPTHSPVPEPPPVRPLPPVVQTPSDRGGLWGPTFGVLLGCGCARAGEPGATVGHVSWCQNHRAVATIVEVGPGG